MTSVDLTNSGDVRAEFTAWPRSRSEQAAPHGFVVG
jgi:hypothetical protein